MSNKLSDHAFMPYATTVYKPFKEYNISYNKNG